VVLGIALVTFAVFDHWYGLFMALGPLVVAIIAAVAITYDQPRGYIQRVAVGIFGFLLFGVGLGHLGYLANDANSVHKQALIKHGRGQLVLSS
jgi:phosphatidate cytidylyltransferase